MTRENSRCHVECKRGTMRPCEVLGNHRRQSQERGLEFGRVSALDREWRTIWIVDAHRDGKRFIVHADEILTAFVELESATHAFAVSLML
jgi:hypothetical protein